MDLYLFLRNQLDKLDMSFHIQIYRRCIEYMKDFLSVKMISILLDNLGMFYLHCHGMCLRDNLCMMIDPCHLGICLECIIRNSLVLHCYFSCQFDKVNILLLDRRFLDIFLDHIYRNCHQLFLQDNLDMQRFREKGFVYQNCIIYMCFFVTNVCTISTYNTVFTDC